MTIPGRSSNSDAYNIGFQGQIKSDEISGLGNHYTAEYWEMDPRLGRKWNVDPMANKAAGWSPYRILFNNPISFTDPLGLFETRKEARAYKKEHGISGRIKRTKGDNHDGNFEIVDKKNGKTYEKGNDIGVAGDSHRRDGVVESTLVSKTEEGTGTEHHNRKEYHILSNMSENQRREYMDNQFNKFWGQKEHVDDLKRQYNENVLKSQSYTPQYDTWEEGEFGNKAGKSIYQYFKYERPLRAAEAKLKKMESKYDRLDKIDTELIIKELKNSSDKAVHNAGE